MDTDIRRRCNFVSPQLFLKLAIKCSDVGHAVKKWEMHDLWSQRVVQVVAAAPSPVMTRSTHRVLVAAQEFYEQGDLEKHLGLEPLPFMIRDTHKTAYSNNQKVGSPLRPPRLPLTLAHICIATGPAPAEDRPSRCRRPRPPAW